VPKKNFRDLQVKEIKAKLERLKRLPDVLDAELQDIAYEVRDTARNMAPIDYGGLRSAIQVKRTAATQKGVRGFIKGKSTFFVYINPITPAIGRAENFVGEYAWSIHEHMGYGTNINVIMPSKRSIEISASAGEVAGGKFLSRATARYKGKVNGKLSKVCHKFVNMADFKENRIDK
jgi:hypothetical protein